MSAKSWTLVAVVLGSGTVFLDSTVVNVALPEMGRDLSSSLFGTLEAQSYVYYGYLLTLSSLLILAGALTDYLGRRRMFAIGLASFGVMSVLCGVAPNMELLILFRVLQGAAGALLVPGSLSIITTTFSGEEQGRAFGVWAGASAGTTILGPALGGALVAYLSWRATFLINIPLIAVALWATLTKMKETRDETASGKFDWLGATVVALAVGGLTFGAIRGQAQEWDDVGAFIALAIGGISAIAFPILMAKSKNPLVPLDLFKSRNFTVTNLSTLVIYGALYVGIQYMALFFIGALGYNELAFGLATIPGSLFLALFSARFGALAAANGPRTYMTVGPAIMGAGILWYTRFPADSDPWIVELGRLASFVPPMDYVIDLLPGQILFGIGLMIMVAPLTSALMRSVPVEHSGVASAVNNAISRVGPQLAGALIFIAITGTFYANLADRVPELDTSAAAVREQIAPLNTPQDAEPGVVEAARESSAEAFHFAMLIAAGLCFAGAAINGIGIRNSEARDTDRRPTTAPSIPPCPAEERDQQPAVLGQQAPQ